MPFDKVSCAAARVRMPARMGPMHGVQPMANAKQITKAPTVVLPPFNSCKRVSEYNALILRIPGRCKPNKIMITPATTASVCLYCAAICPISVEIAPSVMNTTLNPRMNPTEFVMTRRISRPCDDFNSSTPAPDISDTYPGTSGSTHGERNEIRPAKKAAIGSGRLDMRPYIVPAGVYSSIHQTIGPPFRCKKPLFGLLGRLRRGRFRLGKLRLRPRHHLS